MVALLAAREQGARGLAPGGERFAGYVAYHACSVPRPEDPAATGAPALALLGGEDRNVSLPRAGLIAEDLSRGGAAVELRVLPGAWHAWDGRGERRCWVRSHCAATLDRDGALRDEATGRPLRGHPGLPLFLARRARPAGYHMRRDPALARETDAALAAFLDRVAPALAPTAGPAAAVASA
jgi:dienelactone hydrolase